MQFHILNLDRFMSFIQTETGRVFGTFLIFTISAIFLKLLQLRARSLAKNEEVTGHHRGNFVLAKNIVIVFGFALVIAIWASKIAGAALSLAAVAGAILIVSKEFLANFLGSAVLAISRPFGVGDFIEIDGISGRVIDTDMLCSTLAETLDGNQITGRTATIPHSLLLLKPVKNLTATGQFVINLLKISVPSNSDLLANETALLDAAKKVSNEWLVDANEHFKKIESRELVDLPSADPRVIIQIDNVKENFLSLRYACRPHDRVWVEQTILREYLKARPPIVLQEII